MSWSMTANKSDGKGGGTVKAPAGNHLAVLVGIFDMGHQLDDYDPQAEKWQHRAFFVWELVGEQIAGTSKNHVIGIDLTLSLNEKAKLRKWVEARTGKPIPDGTQFDPTTELGQACFLNVIEKNGYPKVDGVAAVPKGIPVPTAGYAPVAVLLSEFQAGTAIPEWCPWLYGAPLAEHVRASRELGGAKPKPKKGGNPSNGSAPSDARPGDGDMGPPSGPDPAAKWDYHDGKAWVKGASTLELQSHISANNLDATKVWVKEPGADSKTAKKAADVGFVDKIPF